MYQRPLPTLRGTYLRELRYLVHQVGRCSHELSGLVLASGQRVRPAAIQDRLKALLSLVDHALRTARELASDADIGEPPDFGRCLALADAGIRTPAGWCASQWLQLSSQVQRSACAVAAVEAMLQADSPPPELLEEGLMQLHEAVSAALEAVPEPAAPEEPSGAVPTVARTA